MRSHCILKNLILLSLFASCSSIYKLKVVKHDKDEKQDLSQPQIVCLEGNWGNKEFKKSSSCTLNTPKSNTTSSQTLYVLKKETRLGMSPAYFFFLGLIPHKSFYYYDVYRTLDAVGNPDQSTAKFEIIDSWSLSLIHI